MASLSERVGPPKSVPSKPSRQAPVVAEAESPPRGRPTYEQLALHPVVLATSAALVVADLASFGFGARGVAGLILLPALVVLSAIDTRHRLLPNRIVLPASGLLLVSQLALASDHGREAALASLAAGAAFFVLRALYPRGLGMGDVKLALLLGAALGTGVLRALFIGSVAAAAAGLVVIARQGPAGRKTTLPFGPFLAVGAVVTFFLG
jgi:prepilin signal peptidase PulO-like enzyme (type II secretory pathway)